MWLDLSDFYEHVDQIEIFEHLEMDQSGLLVGGKIFDKWFCSGSKQTFQPVILA